MSFPRRVAASIFCFLLAGLLLAQSGAIENWLAPPYWLPQKVELTKSSPDVGTEGLEPQAVEGVPTPALAFTGIAPCRIADTRGNGFTGAYGPPSLTAGLPRSFTLTGQCGIPGAAQAVSLNITVTNTQGPGHIVIYPEGGAQPTVSTLNYLAGQTIANAAVVPLGAAGGITVVAGVSGTDLIIDTNGYYAPQTVVNTVNGLSGAVTLGAGTNISITPAGNTLTIANTAPAAWRLTGNAGTTPGTNFIGTTDNQPLELKVNGMRVMRFESSTPTNVIGGSGSGVATGLYGATIAGGEQNFVSDLFGTVGGGQYNRAGDLSPSGGDASYGTVGGGQSNVAGGPWASVIGGYGNVASAEYATVLGGLTNTAAGIRSVAGGRQARANHRGTFVWGDDQFGEVASTNVNQFVVRASGGIWLGTTSSPTTTAGRFIETSTGAYLSSGGAWTDMSDQDSKENFQEVDRKDLLSRILSLPITRWSYKAEGCDVEHLGPTAQDFSAAFGLGNDNRSISSLDSSGVALAAIQALYAEVQELRKRVAELEAAKD